MNKRKNLIIVSCILFFIIVSSIYNSPEKSLNTFNVGVVNIEGPITDSKNTIKYLEDFNKRDDIHAIVLWINSPGGAVVPSQEIYKKVDNISVDNKKPIVASISSLGASGGYYIAIGADKIIANSGSIVGSIGVIMNFPIAKDLFQKIGLKFETFKSGDFKDSGSPYRDVNAEDVEYFQDIVDDLHSQFINEVSVQRDININIVKDLAEGQIFTGNMALKYNLIDEVGTFEDALVITKKMTNIEQEIKLIYPEKDDSIFHSLFESINEIKIFLMEFNNIPLFFMGGMND
tara:strand:- start:331 stop:1197 length:867 start_codon:yes stop_codon:yes gene_type:complete